MANRTGVIAGANSHADVPSAIEARVLDKATVTIAGYDSSKSSDRRSTPFALEDAILLSVQFRDVRRIVIWGNGIPVEISNFTTGETLFCDLRRNCRIEMARPFRSVDFHIPRAAFEALEEEAHSPPTGDVRCPDEPIADEPIHALASALVPELAKPGRTSPLLVDYVATALVAHVASHYGNFLPSPLAARGGLAPWQVRRAQDMLAADLEGSVQLSDVARECGLSVSHFSRAFRATIGLPPHRWLIKRRIESAKLIMRQGNSSLAEIAIRCGFSDQSHFTRVFSRETGASPGQWRRCISA